MELALPHMEAVYRMALRLAGNTYDAEDLTQETFAAAFRRFAQLREETKCRAWLLVILRNLYLRELEHRRADPALLAEGEDYPDLLARWTEREDSEDRLINRLDGARIQPILDRLPERYKTPLLLFAMEEWTYAEIAEALAIPLGTVMSRIARARTFVKREMLRASAEVGGKVRQIRFGQSGKV
jgi:RNA polymerase sigma-70 factor (ECF subfamily)